MTVPSVRIARPADLLGVVPFPLGFSSEDSVVVLVLRRGRVADTARVDADHAITQLDTIARAVAHAEGTKMLAIRYAPRQGSGASGCGAAGRFLRRRGANGDLPGGR